MRTALVSKNAARPGKATQYPPQLSRRMLLRGAAAGVSLMTFGGARSARPDEPIRLVLDADPAMGTFGGDPEDSFAIMLALHSGMDL